MPAAGGGVNYTPPKISAVIWARGLKFFVKVKANKIYNRRNTDFQNRPIFGRFWPILADFWPIFTKFAIIRWYSRNCPKFSVFFSIFHLVLMLMYIWHPHAQPQWHPGGLGRGHAPWDGGVRQRKNLNIYFDVINAIFYFIFGKIYKTWINNK